MLRKIAELKEKKEQKYNREQMKKEREYLMKLLRRNCKRSKITGRLHVMTCRLYNTKLGKYFSEKHYDDISEFIDISREISKLDELIHEESIRQFEARRRS